MNKLLSLLFALLLAACGERYEAKIYHIEKGQAQAFALDSADNIYLLGQRTGDYLFPAQANQTSSAADLRELIRDGRLRQALDFSYSVPSCDIKLTNDPPQQSQTFSADLYFPFAAKTMTDGKMLSTIGRNKNQNPEWDFYLRVELHGGTVVGLPVQERAELLQRHAQNTSLPTCLYLRRMEIHEFRWN